MIRRVVGIRLSAEEESLIRSVLPDWHDDVDGKRWWEMGRRSSPELSGFMRDAAVREAKRLQRKAKRRRHVNESSNKRSSVRQTLKASK